jgi:hypothetical protein
LPETKTEKLPWNSSNRKEIEQMVDTMAIYGGIWLGESWRSVESSENKFRREASCRDSQQAPPCRFIDTALPQEGGSFWRSISPYSNPTRILDPPRAI